MRTGGGKQKGSLWEREVGKRLSLWLTNDTDTDLFCRNVLSGGQFTFSKGKRGASGDLIANRSHPAAFRFLEKYSVECKHWKDAALQEFLLKNSEKCLLSKAIKQAKCPGKNFLLIVKQNFAPPFVITEYSSDIIHPAHPCHFLFNGDYILITLDRFLLIPPNRILGEPDSPVPTQRVRF